MGLDKEVTEFKQWKRGARANLNLDLFSFWQQLHRQSMLCCICTYCSLFFITHIHFSVTRVGSMCSNCLTTTLPVECVCCSWSSLNASPYPGATVCIIKESLHTAEIGIKL